MSLERALELAERGRGGTHPNPIVGCVIMHGDCVVGEAWHEQAGEAHAEVLALRRAGDRARGATAYVTMEPCNHHGRTPPCTEALIEAGVTQVLAGSLDPNPKAGGGLERLREAGIEVAVDDGELGFRARRQNEAWRTWIRLGRPFVILKLALTLDGRVTRPDRCWVTGELARGRVHELRSQVDAVAVGMGTVLADDPQLTARDVGTTRQPRRLAFGRAPLPAASGLELRTGPIEEELRALAADGVQSLLLEGGPRIAERFLRADLVDKLVLFFAPTLAGIGPGFAPALDLPVDLRHVTVERTGEDVLLTGYVHAP
jgi:diaminohydroxyphosphoribosylaminopyrimidine deaminase / 5-amino-6-(5-phosphoribosylamino)uracil reductase